MSSCEAELLSIKNKLLRILDGSESPDEAPALVDAVARLPIDYAALRRTDIGFAMNDLRRRTPDKALAQRIRQLIVHWNAIVKEYMDNVQPGSRVKQESAVADKAAVVSSSESLQPKKEETMEVDEASADPTNAADPNPPNDQPTATAIVKVTSKKGHFKKFCDDIETDDANEKGEAAVAKVKTEPANKKTRSRKIVEEENGETKASTSKEQSVKARSQRINLKNDSGKTVNVKKDSGKTINVKKDSGKKIDAKKDSGKKINVKKDSGKKIDAKKDSGKKIDVKKDSGKKKNVKKSAAKTKVQKKGVPRATNGRDLGCPECTFRTTSVVSWLYHLRHNHNTTPTLARVFLRCDCGVECVSHSHIRQCANANFTVVRKSKEVIRRLTDKKTTPQCTLCQKYPSTIGGYFWHLVKPHKTTLIQKGIYLKCHCGCKIVSGKIFRSHDKKCDGRRFAVHTIDEE